jgi:branched-chain amino acid transport system substrate-binding protein
MLALAIAVGVAVLALALSACGGDDESSSTGATGGGETTSAGAAPTGSPIKIGTVCSCSGPLAGGFSLVNDVYPRWVEYTNEQGGVNGHPVELIVKDDGGNPAASKRAVRELVEQDGVVAVVGALSLVEDEWTAYLAEKGVPVIGGAWYSIAAFTNPNNFSVGASQLTTFYGMAVETKEQGLKKMSVIRSSEVPAGAVIPVLQKAIAEDILGGLEFVAAQQATATQPNYTAQCLTVKDAGAEELYVAFTPAIAKRVFEECEKQNTGARPFFSTGSIGTYDGDAPGVADGTMIDANLSVSATEGEGPELLEAILGDLKDDDEMSDSMTTPIAGLEMFKKAAELAKLTPGSTSEELIDGLYKVKDETLGGLSGPITYTRGKPIDVNCYFVARVEGGELTSTDEYTCIPPAKLEEAAAVLAG